MSNDKLLIFQIVIYHIVVLNDGLNRWNKAMWLITDFLPKAQPENNSCCLHISHNFKQKAKRQTLLAIRRISL